MRESDPALVLRLAAGDVHALGELYDRYARPVYSLALRMLGDVQSAEDVTQEVFLKIWRYAARFDARKGSVGTWILHIAHNVAVDTLRSRQRSLGVQSPSSRIRPDPASPLAGPDEVAERSLLGSQVREALNRLPADQRRALELAYFGARSHREIAAELRIPLGTVKSRLRLALEGLRAALLWPQGKGANDDPRHGLSLH